MYINFIHGYGGDGIFTHTTLYSAPPPNTRLSYDTVWFSFEGGKDTEVRQGKVNWRSIKKKFVRIYLLWKSANLSANSIKHLNKYLSII